MVNFSDSASCDGSVGAGFKGAVAGLLNIAGLGGVFSSISGMNPAQDEQEKLQGLQSNLTAITTKWQTAITNEKFKGLEDIDSFLQALITTSQEQQSVINEVLNEKVSTNSLMIGTLVILVVFLILYDIL